MPEPVRRGKRYMAGLDGLRAIAVLAVIAYHLEFGWAGGGLLGVGIFFTLSGYLITDILARRDMRLVDFWLGRAHSSPFSSSPSSGWRGRRSIPTPNRRWPRATPSPRRCRVRTSPRRRRRSTNQRFRDTAPAARSSTSATRPRRA
jgi:hypothetical protein